MQNKFVFFEREDLPGITGLTEDEMRAKGFDIDEMAWGFYEDDCETEYTPYKAWLLYSIDKDKDCYRTCVTYGGKRYSFVLPASQEDYLSPGKMARIRLGLSSAMHKGNAPISSSRSGKNLLEEWVFRYGKAMTLNGEIVYANVFVPHDSVSETSVYIVNDALYISKNFVNLTRVYASNGRWLTEGIPTRKHKPMDREDAKKIIGFNIDDCKIWSLIQEKARHLFDNDVWSKYIK